MMNFDPLRYLKPFAWVSTLIHFDIDWPIGHIFTSIPRRIAENREAQCPQVDGGVSALARISDAKDAVKTP